MVKMPKLITVKWMFYKKCLSFLGACDNCKIFPSNVLFMLLLCVVTSYMIMWIENSLYKILLRKRIAFHKDRKFDNEFGIKK